MRGFGGFLVLKERVPLVAAGHDRRAANGETQASGGVSRRAGHAAAGGPGSLAGGIGIVGLTGSRQKRRVVAIRTNVSGGRLTGGA